MSGKHDNGERFRKMEVISRPTEAAALKYAVALEHRLVKAGPEATRPKAAGQSVDKWSESWIAHRKAKGLASVNDDLGRYKKWISPVIGPKPIAAIERRDIEAVVTFLDDAVERHVISWKTAVNAWAVVTKMFKDASRSKVKSLRVLDVDPASSVEGPERGEKKSGPYLFPAEFMLVMKCERVSTRWKRLISIATYLYVRASELEALDWKDVNLKQRYVQVHSATDREGDLGTTKTGIVRKVPIEATLMPLLEQMHRESGGRGSVITLPPLESLAPRLRKYVEWAHEDVEEPVRAELLADDRTRRPLTWHDLRHTGVTWRAVRGDAPKRIQRAAGHSDLRTTDTYINEAETFEDRRTFGVPFPRLPLAHLSIPERTAWLAANAAASCKRAVNGLH
ncbi:MAG: tyrosine-type recombinase/integrase [Labilithrix sp.]|nr:tyrosine-type recombinase/integrase [Labilithrix sp.]